MVSHGVFSYKKTASVCIREFCENVHKADHGRLIPPHDRFTEIANCVAALHVFLSAEILPQLAQLATTG